MNQCPIEPEGLRELRKRSEEEGPVFWEHDDQLCAFDPEAAQQFNSENYSDQTLSDRLVDVVRRRRSADVSWQAIRAAWLEQLSQLTEPEPARLLAEQMEKRLEERAGRSIDLAWVAQEVISEPLIDLVLAQLSGREARAVLRDQRFKIGRLLGEDRAGGSLGAKWRSGWIQASAGWVVRRELKARSQGRRPRQLDLTDPIVDMLPSLGVDRGVDAITAMLTAIAGPPGSSATCLLYELTRRPEWRERIAAELTEATVEDLATAPGRVAPATHRFIKESLRLWSLPVIMQRDVRKDMILAGHALKEGQNVLVSAYMTHRDERYWDRPTTFDPDRWLRENRPQPEQHAGSSFSPFGWSPRSCVGAGVAILQSMLLCRLVCARYRVEVQDPELVEVLIASVPQFRGFTGTVSRRVSA